MTQHPLINILSRWPSRQAIADDAGVDLFAVHRWFQRKRVRGEYDNPLIAGAAARGFEVTAQELADARSFHADQTGHAASARQAPAAKKRGAA